MYTTKPEEEESLSGARSTRLALLSPALFSKRTQKSKVASVPVESISVAVDALAEAKSAPPAGSTPSTALQSDGFAERNFGTFVVGRLLASAAFVSTHIRSLCSACTKPAVSVSVRAGTSSPASAFTSADARAYAVVQAPASSQRAEPCVVSACSLVVEYAPDFDTTSTLPVPILACSTSLPLLPVVVEMQFATVLANPRATTNVPSSSMALGPLLFTRLS
mmetsp:Transcript_9491/g.33058  ORF Transcript_9491/g.33058 Transcript_9491/m.33058 type:complete len:221 (-) Transcript_9491:478-1140(-)